MTQREQVQRLLLLQDTNEGEELQTSSPQLQDGRYVVCMIENRAREVSQSQM
jgi:hypothetical protein